MTVTSLGLDLRHGEGMFGDIPAGEAGVIYADPPWRFATWSARGLEGRPQHYPRMSLAEIKALPVAALAARDCVLLMWATDPMIPQALEVIRSWGFEYRTVGFYWVKLTRHGKDHFGNGYWTRANPEQCLLAVRGQPRPMAHDVRRLVKAEVREHSRKPDEMYARIERLAAGPYVELFSRTGRPGWRSWGNDAGRWAAPVAPRAGDVAAE